MEERNHMEDLDVDAEIILKWVLKKYGERACTALIWFRAWTNGWLLCTRK
jgi:hypothetical protein